MKIPKSAQKFMDEEFKRHKEDRKREEKAFGKTTISYIYSVQHACLDLLHFGFKDLKKVASITVTVQIDLKNGAKLGHTTSSLPNIPKLNMKAAQKKGATML
jgi:hypothetical protein